jgi:hypothetical protein
LIRAFGVEVLLAGMVSQDFTSTLKPDDSGTGWGFVRAPVAADPGRGAQAIANAKRAAGAAVRFFLVPRATRGINRNTR